MKKNELRTNLRVWCCWRSSFLYFVKEIKNGTYKFVDITDAIFLLDDNDLERLEIR